MAILYFNLNLWSLLKSYSAERGWLYNISFPLSEY